MIDSAIKIFRNFVPKEEVISIQKYGNGHINDTFLVITNSRKYILQRVNSKVFNIPNLVNNYDHLINHTSKTGITGKFFPIFIENQSHHIHQIDSEGEAWRVSSFVPDTCTYIISPKIKVSKLAGITLGRFQNLLNNLDYADFKDTISNFHNPIKRLNGYDISLVRSNSKLIDRASEEILIASKHRYIANEAMRILTTGRLPVRITHNDPKLENILFKSDNSDAYTIDLDTIMKGCIMFDFGDMVRSITSLAAEDEQNLKKVNFNIKHFDALCRGYFSEIKDSITEYEKGTIYTGIKSIIYIQGLRFLSDFLIGNKYYSVAYNDHNLVRCKTQFKLLSDILSKEDEIIRSINVAIG